MAVRVDRARHEAVFGPPALDGTPGRSRLCPTCGGWHRLDRPWPHNCRPPVHARQHLASPMVAAPFQSYKPCVTGDDVISTRAQRADYMARHDQVDYDEGIRPDCEHWTADRRQRDEIAADLRRFATTDRDYWPAECREVGRIGDGAPGESGEVDVGDIDVIGEPVR